MSKFMPGYYGKGRSDLFVGSVPIERLLENIEEARKTTQRHKKRNRFWASPRELASSKRKHVLIMTLNRKKTANRIQFMLSKYPCSVRAQYWDSDRDEWRDLKSPKGNRDLEISVHKSEPSRISRRPPGKRHPQHHGADHWQTVDLRFRPVSANRFRLVIQRLRSRNVPVDREGRVVPYSLAVKDWSLSFVADKKPQVSLRTESFASTTDLLGSNVSLSVRQYRASDLMLGQAQALVGLPREERDKLRGWKSEPQPVSDAVVNLYVDGRDEEGEAQVIDRFWVEPTTEGVACNLYYSTDDPDGSSPSSEQILSYPLIRPHGDVRVNKHGIILSDEFGYLDIDKRAIQWRMKRDWWMGFRFRPKFSSSSEGEYAIFDSRDLSIFWIDGDFSIVFKGTRILLSGVEFNAHEDTTLIVAYDSLSSKLRVASENEVREETVDPDYRSEAPEGLGRFLRIGAALVPGDADVKTGNMIIPNFVLKKEYPENIFALFQDFSRDPDSYVVAPDYADETKTHNCLIRFHPDFIRGGVPENKYGFLGGPPDLYEDLIWTPVSRDYRLAKGFMRFDPVKAKYFKFEFTNLSPAPYDSMVPISRSVKTFTTKAIDESMSIGKKSDAAQPDSGTKVNERLGVESNFSDQARAQDTIRNRGYEGWTPTEALYTSNLKARDKLAKASPIYTFMPWKQRDKAPRFIRKQKHQYEVTKVQHKEKIAFFVGLSALRMYRVQYSAPVDQGSYLYYFDDDANIAWDDESWWLNPDGGLTTPTPLITGRARTESETISSRRTVLGIQFATAQSDPIQIMDNHDFRFNISGWTPIGGSKISISEEKVIDFGRTLHVERFPSASFWGFMEQRYSSWQDIINQFLGDQGGVAWTIDPVTGMPTDPQGYPANTGDGPTWEDMTAEAEDSSFAGVASTRWAQPSSRGQVHASVRVVADRDLSAPLTLQIMGEDDRVLAQSSREVHEGINEWTTSYTLGEIVHDLFKDGDLFSDPEFDQDPTIEPDYQPPPPVVHRTWGEIETPESEDPPDPLHPTWEEMEVVGKTWTAFDKTPIRYTGEVSARLVQGGVVLDDWYIDDISLWNEAILWEFSNDEGATWWSALNIRNDPHGSLMFPRPDGQETNEFFLDQEGTRLRWRVSGYAPGQNVFALEIRPIYLTLPGGVPVRESGMSDGPNISPYDQYPRVTDAPMFKSWGDPIPQQWYYRFQSGEQFFDNEDLITPDPTLAEQYLLDAFIVEGESTDPWGGVLDGGTPAAAGSLVIDGGTASVTNFTEIADGGDTGGVIAGPWVGPVDGGSADSDGSGPEIDGGSSALGGESLIDGGDPDDA